MSEHRKHSEVPWHTITYLDFHCRCSHLIDIGLQTLHVANLRDRQNVTGLAFFGETRKYQHNQQYVRMYGCIYIYVCTYVCLCILPVCMHVYVCNVMSCHGTSCHVM
jgi:hypothetical protein